MTKKACTFISDSLDSFSFGYDFSSPECISVKLQIWQYIYQEYQSGIKSFYSICEQGIDLWAAEIVTYLMKKDSEVELHCVLPYEEQAAKWYPEFHELYYNVLAEATETVMIDKHFNEYCYDFARKLTVDESSNILVVLPKNAHNKIIDYAKEHQKDLVFSC